MSIFIVRGPEGRGLLQRAAAPLPTAVTKSLVHRALDAGTSIAVRSCSCEQELIEALCAADHSPGEVTLLAPGACVDSVRLQRLLPRLRNAYVEVHDDDGHAFDACLPAATGHRLGVAQGYRAQSYVLALEMALEHLCCNEVGNRVHVGT
ncbi:3-dehydroquinate dehydratase [Stenotrophomonas humi]|uniref:3-dehydroquinate dehydratase n=1 Tax=Stenotrophomonas humi TaxID=405444 RepID=A0A0R0CD58_9GAMM|nr:3-dehydroquinate dehydratase [Stenotrophomonas humi]KRG64087.1 3-dehydroquinate dehydratase [Stenotrophomonas humi]